MRKIVAPISFRSIRNTFAVAAGVSLSGCVIAPPPYEEYTMARAAVKAAQDADSAQFAGGYWTRCEDAFRKGEAAWKGNDTDAAKKFFQQAQRLAERAENATRLKKFQTGDALP